jgi:hypothetical protein
VARWWRMTWCVEDRDNSLVGSANIVLYDNIILIPKGTKQEFARRVAPAKGILYCPLCSKL